MDSGSSWWGSLRCGQDTELSQCLSPATSFTRCYLPPTPSPDHQDNSKQFFIEFTRHPYILSSQCYMLSYLMLSCFVPIQFYHGLLYEVYLLCLKISRCRDRGKGNQQNFHDVKTTSRHILVFFEVQWNPVNPVTNGPQKSRRIKRKTKKEND